MISGARLELRQRAGHGQRQSLHLPDLLPVLLRRVATRAVLVVGVQVVAVDGRARLIRLCHTPGEHDAAGTLHELQLGLLGGRRALGLGGQARRRWCRWERRQRPSGGSSRARLQR